MHKKKSTLKEQDIELLKQFKDSVKTWRSTRSEMSRSEINSMLPRIRSIFTHTQSNQYVTLNAPLMMGGQQILSNVNVLDLIFNCPFNRDVTPYVVDGCDMALGVLNDDNFEYPKQKQNNMRKFNEDDITLFDGLIQQGESILSRYNTKDKTEIVNDKDFNDEYDQWRADVFRLFETHFNLKDIVFQEIGQNQLLIMKMRSAKYVEMILRAMKACYKIPYHKTTQMGEPKEDMRTGNSQPINININNENSQSQNQSQNLSLLVDLLKDSLAPYQLNELKNVAQQDIPVPEKRKNLIDKIMDFGASVGASVLANMLTNPEVLALL